MAQDRYHLSPRELVLLREVLECTWKNRCLVDSADFRARHAEDREVIDHLTANSMLARPGFTKYRVDVLGLDALQTPLSKLVMDRAEGLRAELRKRYIDPKLRGQLYLLEEIAELWHTDTVEAHLTLEHLRDVLSLWGVGLVGELSALVPAGESILDYRNMGAVVSQYANWRQPVQAQSVEEQGEGSPLTLDTPSSAWPPVRACLRQLRFSDIKEILGLGGLDLSLLAHLAKGEPVERLLTTVDGAIAKMKDAERKRFLRIVAEEIVRRRPELENNLTEYLSRLGWTFSNRTLLPVAVFDQADFDDLPDDSHKDLIKAAQRIRDGDLSGAISAACAAVDATTTAVYRELELGDPSAVSFQDRCIASFKARKVLDKLEQQLRDLGWKEAHIKPLKENFQGAFRQGAYVLQTLRSKMGDVHGSKPILRSLVFDCIKWAQLIVASLVEQQGAGSESIQGLSGLSKALDS